MRKLLAQFLVSVPILLYGDSIDIENLPNAGIDLWKKSEQLYLSDLANSITLGLDDDTPDHYYKLAAVELELCDFSGALSNIQQAITIYKTSDTSINSRLSIVKARILEARILGFTRQYIQAADELLSVMNENFAICGKNSKEAARLYRHIGWHLGLCATKVTNPKELSVLNSNLVTLRYYLGQFGLALITGETPSSILSLSQSCYKKSLSITQATVGELHPDTAKSYSLIGYDLGKQKKYKESLETHQKALAIRLQCSMHNNPNTARSLRHIAWCYEKLGDYSNAHNHYIAALTLMEHVLPDNCEELKQAQANFRRAETLLKD
ncbi:MAG: tetratricopeptide repeat protein [Parachlamydiaceae bacterium]